MLLGLPIFSEYSHKNNHYLIRCVLNITVLLCVDLCEYGCLNFWFSYYIF